MQDALKLTFIGLAWLFALGGLAFWLGGRDTQYLSIAAGPADGESFELAMALASVFEATHPNLSVEVYETQGSRENVRLLRAGRVDLATVQADTYIEGGVRALATLYFDAYQLIARADGSIHNVADLAGHRIAIPPQDSGQNRSFWFLVDHYGLDADALTALPMSEDAANFAMRQGQVVAVFRVRAPGNKRVHDLIRHSGDMRLIAIDQPAAMALSNPTIEAGSIPQGAYRGFPPLPEQDLDTAIVDRILVARESLDEELAYETTRMIFEQRSALVAQTRLAGLVRPLPEETRIAIPMHAGARRYYDREKPGILQENSRVLAALLYVLAILTSGFVALRARLKRSRRIRMKDYNLTLMEIAGEAEQAESGSDLRAQKDRLLEILREVVHDLDSDRVTQEEFHHFSFTWQAVDTLLRDRSTPSGART